MKLFGLGKASQVVPNAPDLTLSNDPDLLPLKKRKEILESPLGQWVGRQLRAKLDQATNERLRSITEEMTKAFRSQMEAESVAWQSQLTCEQERYRKLKEQSQCELGKQLRDQSERLTKKAEEDVLALEASVHSLEHELKQAQSALEMTKAKLRVLETQEESIVSDNQLEMESLLLMESKEREWTLQRTALDVEIMQLRQELSHYGTQVSSDLSKTWMTVASAGTKWYEYFLALERHAMGQLNGIARVDLPRAEQLVLEELQGLVQQWIQREKTGLQSTSFELGSIMQGGSLRSKLDEPQRPKVAAAVLANRVLLGQIVKDHSGTQHVLQETNVCSHQGPEFQLGPLKLKTPPSPNAKFTRTLLLT